MNSLKELCEIENGLFYYNIYNCEILDLTLDYHYIKLHFNEIITNLFEFIENKRNEVEENKYLLCCNDIKKIYVRKSHHLLLYMLKNNNFSLDGIYLG